LWGDCKMQAKNQLSQLATLDNTDTSYIHEREMIDEVEDQIKSNLMTQFALGRAFDHYQQGSGVDTVHNVRNGVFSSEQEKDRLTNDDPYDKQTQQKLHGGSETYRSINSKLTEQKKDGVLKDVNTGKILKRNAKADLDHTISTKEINDDLGRKLAGIDADSLANNDSNLHLTDRSINRSMGDQNKTDYAENLERRKDKWKDQLDSINNNSNLTADEKRVKTQNIKNKMHADADSIKENDKLARQKYNSEINRTYYTSERFIKNSAQKVAISGLSRGTQQAIGSILYQFTDAVFSSMQEVVNDWDDYQSLNARIDDFKKKLEANIGELHLRDLIQTFSSGFEGGSLASVANILTNTILTTGKNFSMILENVFVSIVQSIQILKNGSVPRAIRLREATKLILTSAIASVGLASSAALIAGLKEALPVVPLPIIGVLANALIAIITGSLIGIMIYMFDDWKNLLPQVKKNLQTSMYGIKVTSKSLNEEFQSAIQNVDDLYGKLLNDIYDQYKELHQLQSFAYDMGLDKADQFVASGNLAEAVKVDKKRILRNDADIKGYFKS